MGKDIRQKIAHGYSFVPVQILQNDPNCFCSFFSGSFPVAKKTTSTILEIIICRVLRSRSPNIGKTSRSCFVLSIRRDNDASPRDLTTNQGCCLTAAVFSGMEFIPKTTLSPVIRNFLPKSTNGRCKYSNCSFNIMSGNHNLQLE